MPAIVILNVGIEHTMGRVLPHDWLARSAMRQAWFVREGDILLSPVALDEQAVSYLAVQLGLSIDSFTLISPGTVLTDECLVSTEVVSVLLRAMGDRRDWSLDPCFRTPGIVALARQLGLAALDGQLFASQRGSDLLSRKSHFRQLMAGAGLPMPDGLIADSASRLEAAVRELLTRTGQVIVKRDDGAGGDGNLGITLIAGSVLVGAYRTVEAAEDTIAEVAAAAWADLVDRDSPTLVVEAYVPAAYRFYVEYVISGPHGNPRFAHAGSIRALPADKRPDDLVGVGLDLPLDLPPHYLACALTLCGQVAALAGRVGYRGVINIDAIVTEAGDVVCNEANVRWGGGTVLHDLASRLLGPDYANTFAISSARALPAVPLDKLAALLADDGLAFDRGSGEGVLILACDSRHSELMECLVIAGSRDRERALEQRLFDLIRSARS